MRIRWSDRARDDFYAIITSIAEDENNAEAAVRVHNRLQEAIEHLARHPEMGCPGRVDGTRELVLSDIGYILPYRVRGQYLEIAAILRASRRWPESFD
ncbi:MAG TPA: type II toxin-antitoxin system RelE/ParE family toxin [Chloroflexota bacterium]|nr:type II toxin-antitoxin system RelE/ParE family toxin [Chloroflexota bacterium]